MGADVLNPYEVWFALFAFLGVVIVAPTWLHFVTTYLSGPAAVQFLATAMLPLTALLLVAGWLQPGGG